MAHTRKPPADPYEAYPYRREDGKYEGRVKHPNNDIVLTTGNQGYDDPDEAVDVLVAALHYGPHIVRNLDGSTVPPPKFGWMRTRRFRRAAAGWVRDRPRS